MFIFKEFKFLNRRSKSSFMYPESAQWTSSLYYYLNRKLWTRSFFRLGYTCMVLINITFLETKANKDFISNNKVSQVHF